MIKSNFLKKVLMLSLSAALVVTPLAVSANAQTRAIGGNHDNHDNHNNHSNSGNDAPSDSSGGSSSGGSSSGGGSSSSTSTTVATSSAQVKTADGTVIKSTVNGSYTAKSIVTVPSSPAATINAAFGVKAGEQAFVKIADSNYGPAAKASLDAAAAAIGAQIGPVIDISAGILNGNKFSSISNATQLVEFTVGVPANFLQPGCELAIINVQPGGAITFLPNWSADASKMTFYTKSFGVFAFVNVPVGSLDAAKVAQYKEANSIQ